jgi:hypothetical protein
MTAKLRGRWRSALAPLEMSEAGGGNSMGELKNEFSWSYSAATDFEECQRRRYWNKYGKWGGWSAAADPLKRQAYRLDQMDNLYSVLGQAVENGAMHMLRSQQAGGACGVEEAYDKVVKPFMNSAWSDSKQGRWKDSPKKYKCLHEHYYGTLPPERERETTSELVEQAKRCLRNFSELVLPRLAGVAREMEIAVQLPGMGGDAENFYCEDVKIYAIPDFVYRRDGAIHIHDWKAGRRKDSHRRQVAVYGLWADTKHRRADEDICVYIEYLDAGEIVADAVGADELAQVKAEIEMSVADMTEMLVDADRARNEPLPKEEWELALDPNSCRWCRFFELCRDELKAAGVI